MQALPSGNGMPAGMNSTARPAVPAFGPQSPTGVPQFAGILDRFKGGTEGSNESSNQTTADGKPKFRQGSVMQGISRIFRMALLRPRGWAEIALHCIGAPFTIPFFATKHFVEGFVGASSWIKPRSRIFNPMGSLSPAGVRKYGDRTVLGAVTQWWSGFRQKKAPDATPTTGA